MILSVMEDKTMKKAYTKPYADKIQFNYRDQVVAASGVGDIGGGTGDVVQNSGGAFEAYCILMETFGNC